MGVRTVDTYKMHCDRGRGLNSCKVVAIVYGNDIDEAFDELRAADWQVESTLTSWTLRCPKHRTDVVHRPEDLSREQYEALSEEDKVARREQFIAYSDRFPSGQYPCREQLTSETQRYADSQRADGYGPPGVYC